MDAREKNEFDAATYVYWKNQIAAAQDDREKFDRHGSAIVDRYRGDDRLSGQRRYNILYSNTDTLEPVVYAKTPKADVRANDSSVIADRKAAEMVELAIDYYVGSESFNQKARKAIKDFLLPGMGVIRPKYKSLIDKDDDDLERVVFEEIEFDYVYWQDFLMPDVSEWDEMPWIAFRTYMTFDEAVDMFGAEKANMLHYAPRTTNKQQSKSKSESECQMAEVWEIWDKHHQEQIFWAASSSSAPLDINDDPLELDGFYPVPKPLLSIETSNTMLPVPFYDMYQDQALELDAINDRLYHMIDNMRRRGFYNAGIDELGNIENMGDNDLWPVKNWTDFATQGGMAGAVQLEDITSYANIITVLEQSRQQILQDIFQIVGISDIRRAATDPRETLGAQKLKSRYGTIRVSTYQNKVAEYMRDLLYITGDIIVKQFDAQTVSLVTNMPLNTEMEKDEQGQPTGKVKHVGVQDLLTNLREQEPIGISIDVQTDSTIIEDAEEDRAALTAAIAALSDFIAIAQPLVAGIGAEATSKIGMEIIQRFKLGRQIQQEIQDHLDSALANPQEPAPSEAEILAQAELQTTQIKAEFDMMELQTKAALEAAKIEQGNNELALKARELGIDAEFKQEKINLEALNTMIKAQALDVEAANPEDNAIVGV